MRTRPITSLLLTLTLGLGACSSDDRPKDAAVDKVASDHPKPDVGTRSYTPIGPAGGKAFSLDGKAELDVPAGALKETVTFTIEAAPGLTAGNIDVGYDIGPTGQVFDLPATVRIRYDVAKLQGAEEARLRLGTLTAGAGWQVVAKSSVDLVDHSVSGTTGHLSVYGVVVGPKCGDGLVEGDEQCDGAQLAGQSCTTLGFEAGSLACSSCAFDTSGCTKCGDGKINGGDQCDGADLGGKSCTSLGFGAGTLACTSKCRFTGCSTTGYVAVSPGSFTMGSPTSEPCRSNNETEHAVTLTRPFEIGAAEVTQAEFQAAMGYNSSTFSATCGTSCPVETVSWHEAVAYCNALSAQKKLTACYSCSGTGQNVSCSEVAAFAGVSIYDCPGYRLPTDAEWERAYRAGTATAFYNGANDPTKCGTCTDAKADAIAWHTCNAGSKTHPVKQKLANAWGLYDLAGNVWEWVHDWYQLDLGGTPATDPAGPGSGPGRVVRGGYWEGGADSLRAANRYNGLPTARSNLIGFRCARTQ